MKEQVLDSPFCKKEFLELVDIVSEVKTTKLTNYAISDSSNFSSSLKVTPKLL